MSKLFIAGVGVAELYEGEKLFLTSNTLLDSSITIGVQQEELRGGGSNALWGLYFHDTSFSMKLTDIMFNMQYIAANVGTEMTKGGNVFKNESLTADATGKITLSKPAQAFKNGAADIAVFVRPANSTNPTYTRMKASLDSDGLPKVVEGLKAETDYCVRYMYTDGMASKLLVSSQFIPKTLYAILTANLYAGDDKNPTTGTLVGSLTIKIPRFQLNGAMELSMTSSGFSNSGMEGYALATDATGCDGKGIYAEIVQVIYNEKWYTNANEIYFEDSERTTTGTTISEASPVKFNLFALYPATEPFKICNKIIDELEEAAGYTAVADQTKIVYVAAREDGTAVGNNFHVEDMYEDSGDLVKLDYVRVWGTVSSGTYIIKAHAAYEDSSSATPHYLPENLVAEAKLIVA